MNRSDDIPQPGGQPNSYWERAFADAATTPPPRVWEGVERQLDLDDADGILPLWQHKQGRQSMLFGRWAAGIAASLLLTALGWWAWHRENAIRPHTTVAVAPTRQQPGQTAGAAQPALANGRTANAGPLAKLAPTRSENRINQLAAPGTNADFGVEPVEAPLNLSLPGVPRKPVQAGSVERPQRIIADQFARQNPSAATANPSFPLGDESVSQTTNGRQPVAPIPPVTAETGLAGNVPDVGKRLFINALPLNPLPFMARVAGNERIVWYNSEAKSADNSETASGASTPKKSASQRVWLSAGFGASAFNPSVALREAVGSPTYLSSAMMSNNALYAQALSSEGGQAVTFQAAVGVAVGSRWSIETGVGYLSGQHQVVSPQRLASAQAKELATGNLYADLLQQAIPERSSPLQDQLTTYRMANSLANPLVGYSLATTASLPNSYQFMQVPVQIGYELRPRRKFGLTLLTGLVSNWFVRHKVADEITIGRADDVYRPVTMAGSAGMRLRFRPDKRWSASLAGTFQRNLQSLTLNDINLQAIPQQVGVNFTIDRHF